MTDLLNTQPPDDTGTDTLKRYRYQAQLAVPFCLDCASGGKVLSVVMEHYEDIVVEYEDYWWFIQVKTRDAGYGPWRLTTAMDGLASLYRTYSSTYHLEAKYGLFLEGAVAHDDDLNKLVPIKPTLEQTLIDRVTRGLGDKGFSVTKEQCEAFLKITTVHPNQPPREHVTNHNVNLLAAGNINTPQDEVKVIEKRVTDEVLRAMSQDPLEDLIPAYISDPDNLEEEERRRVDDKRLTPARLTPILGALAAGAFPLLRRVVRADLTQPTTLEKKLIAGGATPRVITNAQSLRANASVREAEVTASQLFGSEGKLDDVHHRIEVLANAVVERYEGTENPARQVWGELLRSLQDQANAVDPNMIYKRDPYLLLGAACGLSDECRVDWGVRLA
jgi:hypothetical protein